MQTQLADWIKDSPRGLEADAILRKCVHCGFCLATCPTYNLLGDELDSPRGRIYLMKQMLEGSPVTERTQRHLDRCLTCRACETTCPSGVEYGRLVNIGRALVEERVPRKPGARVKRWFLKSTLPHRGLFAVALALGRALRPLLPASLGAKIPTRRDPGEWPAPRHARRMLVMEGCVQPSMAPTIDSAAARVLDRLGISLVRVPRGGCCGAVAYHLEYQEEGLDYARANIDAWWPLVEAGAEAIVVTASGCGTQVKEYGHLLSRDPVYAARAARISALARDVSEVVAGARAELAALPKASSAPKRIAFHSPCSLQHGQKLTGVVESILREAGFTLTPVRDAHLCCGSAGAYSLLQPRIAKDLRNDKVQALEAGAPE
ncbi:MAG TPA: glycolate oxidase subunit GlcF, partial [Usitatibacter sp.]|nr:glycolate oxidase subunit GlcF [Usitatibacter sp.]